MSRDDLPGPWEMTENIPMVTVPKDGEYMTSKGMQNLKRGDFVAIIDKTFLDFLALHFTNAFERCRYQDTNGRITDALNTLWEEIFGKDRK